MAQQQQPKDRAATVNTMTEAQIKACVAWMKANGNVYRHKSRRDPVTGAPLWATKYKHGVHNYAQVNVAQFIGSDKESKQLVHLIWWRHVNGYAFIQADQQISHLDKDASILRLKQESWRANESRKACHELVAVSTAVHEALVDTAHGNPRRLTVGLDAQRLAMLLAVLHRHGGVAMHDQDVFINVVGGVRVSETAADLPALLALDGPGPDLGDWLHDQRYSLGFRDDHLVPMASALWSSPHAQVLKFPVKYLVAFMANHHMLQVEGRPVWQVVAGGSQSYVRTLTARWKATARTSSPSSAVMVAPYGIL